MQCIQQPESPLIVVTHKRQNLKAKSSISDNGTDTKSYLRQGETAVYIRNLCKCYQKGIPVLQNLCMNVGKGTIYGLLGSSGSGKTTILSCIVGLSKWNSGDLKVFGKSPGSKGSGIPGRRLGYMPQDVALYRELSISEIIQLYGRIYNMPSTQVKERWNFLSKLLDLSTHFKQIGNLSGGQKRRASLALALLHSPELLVLDEPTVGLDPLLRQTIWEYMHEMVNSLGTTIIVTTHYNEEARCANTIGLIRKGRLLVEDTPYSLLQNYQHDLLEQVILQICRKDQNGTANKDDCGNTGEHKVSFKSSWNDSVNHQENPEDEHMDRGVYRETCDFDDTDKWDPHKLRLKNGLKCNENGKDNIRNSGLYQSFQRIYGLVTVITLAVSRYRLFLAAALLLPSIMGMISVLVMGTKPRGMQLGIVNHELANWTIECDLPRHARNSCDLAMLSCKFLEELESGNVVVLNGVDSEEEALAQVEQGKSMGYLTFPVNYSQNTLDFATAKQFAFNDSIEGSVIRARLDNSQYLAAIFTMQHMFSSYLDYIHNLALSCGLGGKEAEISPFSFRPPVYGNNDENYTDYILPGAILDVIINISSTLTALIYITDRKQGTLSRARVAGLTHVQLIASHLIIQGVLAIVQMAILAGILQFFFGFVILGSPWLLLICLLMGLCGAVLGIFLGIICHDEVEVLVIELLMIPFLLVFGAVFCPTEVMPKAWRFFGNFLPIAYSTISLRSVIVRGLGLMHPLVWPGVVVLFVWILFLSICCIVAYKLSSK